MSRTAPAPRLKGNRSATTIPMYGHAGVTSGRIAPEAAVAKASGISTIYQSTPNRRRNRRR